jgi:hypothetical protein
MAGGFSEEKIKSLIKDTDDCINYPILNKDGYGCIQQVLNGRKLHMLTHRIVYQLYYNIYQQLIRDIT